MRLVRVGVSEIYSILKVLFLALYVWSTMTSILVRYTDGKRRRPNWPRLSEAVTLTFHRPRDNSVHRPVPN